MQETHICSFVIYINPKYFTSVIANIDRLNAIECGALDSTAAKAIVIAEAESMGAMDDHIQRLNSLTGVLSVNMVFHQVESLEGLDQELIVCN